MITDVILLGSNRLTVLDESGDEISHRYLGYEEELVGFSSEIIVIQSGSGRATIYDQDFEEVSHRFLVAEEVKHVVGERVTTRRSDRTITYDRDFEQVGQRFY